MRQLRVEAQRSRQRTLAFYPDHDNRVRGRSEIDTPLPFAVALETPECYRIRNIEKPYIVTHVSTLARIV